MEVTHVSHCVLLSCTLHRSGCHAPETQEEREEQAYRNVSEEGSLTYSRPPPQRRLVSRRQYQEWVQDFAILYGIGPPPRRRELARSQSPPPDGLNEPGEEVTISAEEYRSVLMVRLSEAQLDRRRTKLRQCLREAVQKEAQAVFAQYFEGQCIDDANARHEVMKECQRVAEERTADLALRNESKSVDGALSIRQRTCGRCWQQKRSPGCGGCQWAVPWPRPPRHEQPPPHWHDVRPLD